MTMSLIPIGYLLYQFTGPGNYEHKYLTRVINSYDGYRKDAAHIAALHTDALEQAAADRNLFANTERAQNVTLRFPEYVQISSYIPSTRHQETHIRQQEEEPDTKTREQTHERHAERIGRLTKFCRQDSQHWSPSQRARRPLRRHVTSHCQVREGGIRGQRKEVAADQGQRCPQRTPFQGPSSYWRRDCVDVDIPCQQRIHVFFSIFVMFVARVQQKCCRCYLRQASQNSSLRLNHAGLNVHVVIQILSRVRSVVYLEATCLTLLV
jgi:hypothetical protein